MDAFLYAVLMIMTIMVSFGAGYLIAMFLIMRRELHFMYIHEISQINHDIDNISPQD